MDVVRMRRQDPDSRAGLILDDDERDVVQEVEFMTKHELVEQLRQVQVEHRKLSQAIMEFRSKCDCETINQLPMVLAEEIGASDVGGSGQFFHGHDTSELPLSYLQTNPFTLARSRVIWLSIFLTSLSLTAVVMENFEHILQSQIELSFFVPLMIGHGGTALGLGAAIASTTVMGVSHHVAMVVFATLPVLSVTASGLAALLPFMCLAFGLDASVVAAPLMTTLVDVLGLVSYFLIAKVVFCWYGLHLEHG
eukprot:CFRG5423T1